MQVRIYSVPLAGGESIVDEMNAFLRSHKVVDIQKEFVNSSIGACWTFCITYLLTNTNDGEHKQKVDYKQVLDEIAFAKFSRLRAIRKQLAEKDAVPAYAVFTDAELAEMAKEESLSTAKLKKIEGIGEKRIEKYGNALIEQWQQDETSGIPNGANQGQGESVSSLF